MTRVSPPGIVPEPSDSVVDGAAEDQLAEIKAAMTGEVRLCILLTFTHGDAVQVEARQKGRWRKVGPLIFPPKGGTTADTLAMLAGFRRGDKK